MPKLPAMTDDTFVALNSAIQKVKESHADPSNKELAQLSTYSMMVCYRRALQSIRDEKVDDTAYLAHMVLYLETL